MNNYEKEVVRSRLNAERQTLFRLKKIYEQAAKDVSEKLVISNDKIEILLQDIDNSDEQTKSILQSQIYQRSFQKNLKSQLDKLLEDFNDRQFDTISEYLKSTYDNSFIGTLYNLNTSGIPVVIPIDPDMIVRAINIDSRISKPLYEKLEEDVERLKKRIANNIARGISTASPYRDIARNIASNSNVGFNRAMRIVRTESGRIYNAASLDSGKAAKYKTGADLVKVWDSTLDSLTRPHHRQLDNQVRELDEDFEVSGLTASAPGHFGIAKEDINCRCVCLVKPRWDLEGPFTKRNNETGELLEFQDVQNYEDFKKKFWKNVDNSGEGGIIDVGSDMVALENQRYGRNKDTLVNKTYIESGEYRRKFDKTTDNPDVNKTLYECAKKALKHRSGTVLEDMYWIDGDTGEIVTKEIDGTLQRKVEYSTSTKKIVSSYEKNKLITIHTHPSSMPPSAGDFNACFHHGYKCGYVACHDGRIFAYTAGEEINTALYNMYIEAHIKQHKSEFESQILALNEIKRNCKIEFWEVI